MTYGTSLGVELPDVADEVNWPGPLYAQQTKDVLQAIIDRLETKVTAAGIDIQDTLEFNGNLADELLGVRFENQDDALDAALYPRTIYWKDQDLYVNDGSGRQVRLITGGALDVSSSGGVTGSGYGSGGVEINWDTSAERYRLKSGSDATDYASAEMLAARLASGTTGFFASLGVASGMVADLDWTLPAAHPASTSVVTIDSSGQMILTRALSVDTIAAAGLITASAGLTGASDQHVTVAGLGRFKHGTMVKYLTAAAGFGGGTYNGVGAITVGANSWSIPIDLPVGARILGLKWTGDPGSAGTKTFALWRIHKTTLGSDASVASTTSTATGGRQQYTLSVSHTMLTDYVYVAEYTGVSGDVLIGLEITYDFP